MSLKQVLFLSTVNNRYKDLETLAAIQVGVASQGRQMDEMGFSTFTNRLRYG